jgi:uncharacterized membrane protein
MTATATLKEDRLARGLGWFSIGLGLAAFLAPRGVARLIGVKGHRGLIRLVGLREITSGIGILGLRTPSRWVKSRVGGDAMDLAFLGSAMVGNGNNRTKVAAATAAVAGITALDVMCSKQLSQKPFGGTRTVQQYDFKKVITINRSPEELYQFWHNFENLPRFMKHLKSVTVSGGTRSHWVALAPGGGSVAWDAEMIQDIPNKAISWQSAPDSTVQNSGTVHFLPATGGRGTIIKVDLQYRPPLGALGATFAKIMGESPEHQVMSDLRRLKQLLETGEIPTTEGQPAGRKTSTSPRFDKWARSLAEV